MNRGEKILWVRGEVFDEATKDEVRKYLQTIIEEGQRVHKLVYARYEDRKAKVDGGEVIRLSHLLDAAIPLVEKTWGEDDLTLLLARVITLGDFIF